MATFAVVLRSRIARTRPSANSTSRARTGLLFSNAVYWSGVIAATSQLRTAPGQDRFAIVLAGKQRQDVAFLSAKRRACMSVRVLGGFPARLYAAIYLSKPLPDPRRGFSFGPA